MVYRYKLEQGGSSSKLEAVKVFPYFDQHGINRIYLVYVVEYYVLGTQPLDWQFKPLPGLRVTM